MKMSELYSFMKEHGGASTFFRFWEVADSVEMVALGEIPDRELDADDMAFYIADDEPSPEASDQKGEERKAEDEANETAQTEPAPSLRFTFHSYTEWHGSKYVTTTKVYDRQKYNPGWSGCHWDDPRIIRSEQVDGACMSDEMKKYINSIDAVDVDELDD